LKKLDSLFIGLMLFSMFFGAGNLIFPAYLGEQSGTSFWPAILGFVATGVGLPVIVLVAVSLVKGGAQAIGDRVHPVFSTVFMVVIYLCIGPFLAIPRNATVAYEMTIVPFTSGTFNSSLGLLLFTICFFGLVYIISLNPTKMEEYMGKWITPILILAIVILCGIGFINLDGSLQTPSGTYQQTPFTTGFIEGYNTMDALASLAFGIVILTAIGQKGIKDRKQLTSYAIKAGVIAGILLSVVYISLGLLGGKMAGNGTFESGTEILSATSTLLLGPSGTVLLGIIFTLACFTTVVGLTAACGQYFSNLFPKFSYKTVVIVFTLIGFVLSNLGLSQILKVSVPFLVTAYPLTIVLTVLTFLSRYFHHSSKVYGSAMLFTGVFAAISGLNIGPLQMLSEYLPFASYGLEWIVPAIVGTIIGMILKSFDKKTAILREV